jgi:CheY-like chemotaxis protein
MEEMLDKINETFDNCMINANEETQLQLKIIKTNINQIVTSYMPAKNSVDESVQVNTNEISNMPSDGKKILIVDDSSIVRNYLEKILVTDYTVELATDGEDAISYLDNVNEDDLSLILLDLMMPTIDGFEVLEYLNARALKIPVIIISGDTSQDTIHRAFSYKVADMIEKPFDAKTILSKIANVI